MHSIRLVMNRTLGHGLAILLATIAPLMAADSAATVTEVVNEVTHGTSQSADTTPAKAGTTIQDGEYLKTGAKSRAELSLANQSITRMGANTIFNYSVANNEVDLQAGTILFSKPKDGKEMTIKTASVTAAIVGTTGFASLVNKAFLFGIIEGHATVIINGVTTKVEAGQVLRLADGGKAQVVFYNIPLFLKTSPLVNKFHSALPNQVYIDREVADYNDFASRGFIAPPVNTYVITGFDGSIPLIPIQAHDSAANSLEQFNQPPKMAPPPTNNPG
jgi:hypothetical protein